MAVGDFFGNLKNKVLSVYNNFFYDNSEAPVPRMQEEYPRQEQAYARQQGEQWQNPQQAPASYGMQGQGFQQPYQQQPYGQGMYQQPYQPSAFQPAAAQQPQQPAQGRTRRAQQHAAQQTRNNVVDFGAYQQQSQPAQASETQEAPAQQSSALLSARVINASGMGDCRSAITLLRNGDAVLIVLENIADAGEMRRLVDTLSGACYSLTATITKVSRHGVYLLAPQTLAVYADQATNMMNSAPARAQARNYQPMYGGQRVSYSAQGAQPQAAQPRDMRAPQQQANPYGGVQGFTQRSAVQEEAPQNFYQRPMPQAAQPQSFSPQPVGYGYAPDESAAVDQ